MEPYLNQIPILKDWKFWEDYRIPMSRRRQLLH